MKLLIDVNLSPKWVTFLAAAGHEAVRWTEVGAANASDSEIMRYAASNGYVVMTHDQDFSTLLALSRAGEPSVVLLRLSSLRVEKIGDRVLRAIEALTDDLDKGAIAVVEDKRVRVRDLPMENG